jgi:hypothetical protein
MITPFFIFVALVHVSSRLIDGSHPLNPRTTLEMYIYNLSNSREIILRHASDMMLLLQEAKGVNPVDPHNAMLCDPKVTKEFYI